MEECVLIRNVHLTQVYSIHDSSACLSTIIMYYNVIDIYNVMYVHRLDFHQRTGSCFSYFSILLLEYLYFW